jgi:hypothetical protein
MYVRVLIISLSVWFFTPPAQAQSAESLLALWATQTGQNLTKGLSKQVSGLATDIVRVPRAAIPIIRLPIGLLKTTMGAVLPGQSASAGTRDINAGMMAPINTLERLIDIPVNVLERF